MQDLMTYEDTSKLLNVKVGTLYALVSQRRIPHVRLGRRLVRFDRAEIEAWLQQRAVAPAPDGATNHK
jgi:excisionase family DNA binding protein